MLSACPCACHRRLSRTNRAKKGSWGFDKHPPLPWHRKTKKKPTNVSSCLEKMRVAELLATDSGHRFGVNCKVCSESASFGCAAKKTTGVRSEREKEREGTFLPHEQGLYRLGSTLRDDKLRLEDFGLQTAAGDQLEKRNFSLRESLVTNFA